MIECCSGRGVKFGDERRPLVMRVPPEAAEAFKALVADSGASRSATLARLIVNALTVRGRRLDDPRFDALSRREASKRQRK